MAQQYGELTVRSNNDLSIRGSITNGVSITTTLVSTENIVGKISASGGGGSEYPTYTGPTEVTPKSFQAQTLNTAFTVVEDNIIVKKIPYIETSNISGITVYIGDTDVN